MPDFGAIIGFFLLVLSPEMNNPLMYQDIPDTSSINNYTRNALNNARRNPDLAIIMAHKALSESEYLNYKKGAADSYLALGTAWLAKYNPRDSALYYCLKAYDLYGLLTDNMGMGRSCYALAYVYSFKSDLKESERYCNLCLGLFEKADFKPGIINTYNVLSYLANQEKDLEKARNHIEKAIEIARSINDTLQLADVTNSLGNIYSDMALFGQAIDTYFEALRLWEIKKDSNGIALAYGNIGLMYYYQKEYDKALEFNLKKLPVSESKGDLWEMAKTYNNIATIYNSRSDFVSALSYFRKSLRLNSRMNLPSGVASLCNNIASTLLLLSQPDSALWYVNRAVSIGTQINAPALADYYVTFGNVMRRKKNYQPALQNALKAYELGRRQKNPLTVSDASILLSDIYYKINQPDLAYRYLKKHMQLRDSISNDEFLKQVTRMEIQYDFDKKQKATEYARMEESLLHENSIKQKNLYLRGLMILLILVAFFSFLYIRHNRLRSRYVQIDLEQRLLRAQMNPHFIFNSLCAVQDFILAGKSQKANTFLTKIARLMRNILENSREEFIPLEKEIETVKYYLDLQQLRFETEFEYIISLDDTIDPENISVPPMLTQPCVENSIEHGLLQLKEKGRLKISYRLSNGLMILEVTDNGIGRKEAEKIVTERRDKKSVSTKVTAERLENFRKTLRQKNISYEIIDLFDKDRAAGTKVIMKLPYKKVYG
jgi:tetratricopeptide (TPR) repeat protein